MVTKTPTLLNNIHQGVTESKGLLYNIHPLVTKNSRLWNNIPRVVTRTPRLLENIHQVVTTTPRLSKRIHQTATMTPRLLILFIKGLLQPKDSHLDNFSSKERNRPFDADSFIFCDLNVFFPLAARW